MAVSKVYISSTYRDLKSYRETVRTSLHKFPNNFQVIGMEDYVAENIEPLEACLRDVAACDIYILILANRYGYVNAGQPLSITHQEYNKAKELNKVILVFKAENQDGRFPPDADDPGQPSSAQKQAKLNELKAEVSRDRLSHPEGFTSEYHLALQVMESLVRNPDVDFDGELPEDRKIFCDRANQVYDFYDLVREKQPFNVFLIQGQENDLGQSLAERLSKYYLGTIELTPVSYNELIQEALYAKFRKRLINELCLKFLFNEPDPPSDFVGLLSALKAKGTSTLAILSSVSDAVQWQTGYQFLDTLFLEFSQASATVDGIHVYWFVVIDSPEALQQQVQSVNVLIAPKLTILSKTNIKDWVSTYINNDSEIVSALLELPELNFSGAPALPSGFTMKQAQMQIRKFIKRFNLRRKNNDQELLDILS